MQVLDMETAEEELPEMQAFLQNQLRKIRGRVTDKT
jgi:hypothetical protein